VVCVDPVFTKCTWACLSMLSSSEFTRLERSDPCSNAVLAVKHPQRLLVNRQFKVPTLTDGVYAWPDMRETSVLNRRAIQSSQCPTGEHINNEIGVAGPAKDNEAAREWLLYISVSHICQTASSPSSGE